MGVVCGSPEESWMLWFSGVVAVRLWGSWGEGGGSVSESESSPGGRDNSLGLEEEEGGRKEKKRKKKEREGERRSER